jgi:hypothetical protein
MAFCAQTKIHLVTPGRIILRSFLLVFVLVLGGSILTGMACHLDLRAISIPDAEVDAQLRSIKRRLLWREDELQEFIMPEGPFLTNVFYGYSLVNAALSRPSDEKFKNNALQELERVFSRLPDFRARPPFSWTDKALPGGIIYAGNVNRLRAGYILLGGKNQDIINGFHDGSRVIFEAFSRADPPFPESFKNLTWTADSICALDSLRLHDKLFDTGYFEVRHKWLAWLKAHLDPQTHLMIAQAGGNENSIVDGTRACAMSWLLSLMPGIDEEFSQQQYSIFRKYWFVPLAGGFLGIQEWYQGREKASDFKPGPVVAGLGAAATGLGIAATRANSDWESWHRILRSLETIGLPLNTIYGEKTYFCGQSLLCDTIALWGKTIVAWKTTPPAALICRAGDVFPLTVAACAVVYLLLSGILVREIIVLCTRKDYIRPETNRITTGIAIFQGTLAAGWILSPLFSWMQIMIIMAITDLMEELILRPRVIARLYREAQEQEIKSE